MSSGRDDEFFRGHTRQETAISARRYHPGGRNKECAMAKRSKKEGEDEVEEEGEDGEEINGGGGDGERRSGGPPY